jgi:uncharacterized protein
MLSADEIRRRLRLQPHPEGGYYRETFRDVPTGAMGRAASTAIYFLLEAGEVSRWHRVDAAEVWHFHAGAPLALSMSPAADQSPTEHRLGIGLDGGEAPQIVVPAGYWQQARSLGAWTLVGCTVAPGFTFDHFELAAEGFEPGRDRRGV